MNETKLTPFSEEKATISVHICKLFYQLEGIIAGSFRVSLVIKRGGP